MKMFFTSADVARICGMSVPTVLRLYREGELKGYRLHGNKGALRVPRESLIEFMDERGIPTTVLDPFDEKRKHVLVVGDEEGMLRKLKANLAVDARIGCATRVTHTAEDIVTACRSVRPDLIILDLKAPGLGREILGRIRSSSELAAVKIAVFGDSSDFKAKVLKAGADDFVVKPDFDELRRAAYRLLGIERRR